MPAQRLAGALVIAQDLARRDLLIPCCQGEVLVMAIDALDGDGGTGITLMGARLATAWLRCRDSATRPFLWDDSSF